jgi:hypothetical protein
MEKGPRELFPGTQEENSNYSTDGADVVEAEMRADNILGLVNDAVVALATATPDGKQKPCPHSFYAIANSGRESDDVGIKKGIIQCKHVLED